MAAPERMRRRRQTGAERNSRPNRGSMTNEHSPHETKNEILTERECAALLSVRRETLSRLRRDAGLPFLPLSTKGPRPRIRYVRSHVMAWVDANSVGLEPTKVIPKRGRPKNVDRPRDKDGRGL
jgi:hypothetical protein